MRQNSKCSLKSQKRTSLAEVGDVLQNFKAGTLFREDAAEQLTKLYNKFVKKQRILSKKEFTEMLDGYQFSIDKNQEMFPQMQISDLDYEQELYIFDQASAAKLYIDQFFAQKISKYTLLNRDKSALTNYITTDLEFNQGIIDFKNHLIKILVKGLNLGGEFHLDEEDDSLLIPFFSKRGCDDYEGYTKLMSAFNNWRQSFDLKGIITSDSSGDNIEGIDIFAAGYILNNFDTFLDSKLQGIVSLDEDSFGDIHNTKYAKELQNMSTVYWINDTHADHGSSKYVSNLAKFIVSTLPRYQKVIRNNKVTWEKIPNSYLSSADLFQMSTVIKQAIEQYNVLHPDKQLDLLTDPQLTLETILTTDEKIPVLQDFERIIVPLRMYLYTSSDSEYSIREIYNRTIPNNLRILDVEGLLAFELSKTSSPSYITYDETGLGKLNNKGLSNQASQQLDENIEGFIIRDARRSVNKRILSKKGLNTIQKSTLPELKANEAFQQICRHILGIKIDPSIATYDSWFNQEVSSSAAKTTTTNLDVLKNIISYIRNSKAYSSRDKKTRQEITQLAEETIKAIKKIFNYTEFKESCYQFFARSPMMNIKNANGDSIPVHRVASTALHVPYLLQNFYKSDKELAKHINFLAAYPHILSNINDPNSPKSINYDYKHPLSVKLELVNGDVVEMKRSSPVEQLIAGFVGDYLSQYDVTTNLGNQLVTQIATYSDKTSILGFNTNLLAKIEDPNAINPRTAKKITIQALMDNTKLLQKVSYKYSKNALLNTANSILETWSKILSDPKVQAELKDLNIPEIHYLNRSELFSSFNNSGNLSSIDFLKLWDAANKVIKSLPKKFLTNSLPYHASRLGLNIVPSFHYEMYNGTPELKRIIRGDLVKKLDFDTYTSNLEKLFENRIKSINITVDGESVPLIDYLTSIVKSFKESHTAIYDKLGKGSEEKVTDALYKYFISQIFLRKEFKALLSKEHYLHPSKGDFSEDILGLDKEESVTFSASTKRTVIYTGSTQNYLQKSLVGVSPEVNFAIVKDQDAEAFTALGIFNSQDIHDGCSLMDPIQSRMIDASLPGMGVTGIKKTLGAHIGDEYESLYKWAENPITNSLIRDSLHSDIRVHNLLKTMWNIEWKNGLNILENFGGNQCDIDDLTNGKPIYVRNAGEIYRLLNIDFIDGYTYKITYAKNNGDGTATKLDKTVELKTLWDVYQAFGGCEALEKSVDNKFFYTELNLDMMYNLVINCSSIKDTSSWPTRFTQDTIDQPLRKCFITNLVTAGAVKQGGANINPKETWKNPQQLATTKVNTATFGLQLDANHEADQSNITEPTQMISSLAALGYTRDLAAEAYELLAVNIRSNLQKASDRLTMLKSGNIDNVIADISEEIVDKLKHDKTINLSQAIINTFYDNQDRIKLTLSDQNFYRVFTSTVLADLSKSVLRSKWNGLGGVLAMSSGMIQMFRFNNQVYLMSDLLNKANNLDPEIKNLIREFLQIPAYNSKNTDYFVNPEKNEEFNNLLFKVYIAKSLNPNLNITPEVLSGIQEKFDSTPIYQGVLLSSKSEAEPLDTVVYQLSDGTWNKVTLDTCKKCFEFYHNPNIVSSYRMAGIPADLKPQIIHWDVENVKMSDFTTPASRLGMTLNLHVEGELESNRVNTSNISNNTASFGVEIDSNLIKNYKQWKSNNPTGIVAYRVNKTKFNTPEMVANGIIGNPFDWQKYGVKESVQMFYDWIVTGNNFSEPNATDDFRLAILTKLQNSDINTPILYYKELNEPSHATILGYLINHKELLFNQLQELEDFVRTVLQNQAKTERLENWESIGNQRAEKLIKGLNSTDKTIRKYSKNQIQKLIDDFAVRSAELLSQGKYWSASDIEIVAGHYNWNDYLHGIDITKDLHEDELTIGSLPDIHNYTVHLAEIIVPKLHRSNYHLGRYSLNDINEDFFKRANSFYQSNFLSIKEGILDQKAAVDLLVRTHSNNFNIVVVDNFSDDSNDIYGEIKSDINIQNGYRLGKHKRRMYLLNQSKVQIRVDSNGNETLLFKSSESTIDDIKTLLDSTTDIVSIAPIFDNIATKFVNDTDDLIEFIRVHNVIKTTDGLLESAVGNKGKSLVTQLKRIYTSSQDRYIKDYQSALYNSFVSTLKYMATRIPTQALQSFMSMQAVAFNESMSNEVFVTRWQLWLQGSDLDIDKSYLLALTVDKNGLAYHWSSQSDYTSAEKAKISDELPMPNNKLLISADKAYTAKGKFIPFNFKAQVDSKLTQLIKQYLSLDPANDVERFRLFKDITVELNKDITNLEGIIEFPIDFANNLQFNTLIAKINSHNSTNVSIEATKNFIAKAIAKVSTDSRNAISGYSTVDRAADLFKTAISELIAEGKQYAADDLMSVFELQYENSVGKDDVGIMANGLKAFFALTQYFNNYFRHNRSKEDIITSTEFSLRKFRLKTLQKIKGKLQPVDLEYVSPTISDIRMDESELKALNEIYAQLLPEYYEKAKRIAIPNDDASLLISALVTLATDNAKTLALAKIRAGLELASMHVFLTIMGFSAEQITGYTQSPIFAKATELLQSNIFDEVTGKFTSDTWKSLEAWAVDNNQLQEYIQFKQLYNSAQELTTFARLLSINQGVKADDTKAAGYLLNFSKIINQQIKTHNYVEFISDGKFVNPDDKFVTRLIEDHGFNIEDLHTDKLNYQSILRQKIDFVNSQAEKYNFKISTSQVDMNLYFSDINYRNFIVALYDIIKDNFNIYDAVNHSPHFYAMMEGFNTYVQLMIGSSIKAKVSMVDGIELYNKGIVNLLYRMRNYTETNKKRRLFNVPRAYSGDFIKSAQMFVDDYMISRFLTSTDKYNFDIDVDGNKYEVHFGQDLLTGWNPNLWLDELIDFVNDELIPELQDQYPDSEFLNDLDWKIGQTALAKANQTGLYVLRHDLDDLNSSLVSHSIIGDFSKNIMNLKISDIFNTSKMTGNTDMTVGDVLYLYHLITKQNSFGQNSLSRIFESYCHLPKSIFKDFYKFESRFDLKQESIDIDPQRFVAYLFRNKVLNNKTAQGLINFGQDGEEKTNVFETIDTNVWLINLAQISANNEAFNLSNEIAWLIENHIINLTGIKEDC